MLTRIGCDVKVVDLGCCYSDTFVDSTGYTTQYAAPEQLAGRKVDVRTDIYAVGKILELLPHPPIYNKVIKRCLNKNPQNRYQTIAELQKALSVRNYNKKEIVAAVSIVLPFLLFCCWLWQILFSLCQMKQRKQPETKSWLIVKNARPRVYRIRWKGYRRGSSREESSTFGFCFGRKGESEKSKLAKGDGRDVG